jgi:hypothetical protein
LPKTGLLMLGLPLEKGGGGRVSYIMHSDAGKIIPRRGLSLG